MDIVDHIIQALKGGELPMRELVAKVQANTSVRSSTVKAAVLSLIIAEQVRLMPDLKLSLRA